MIGLGQTQTIKTISLQTELQSSTIFLYLK